jgi:hypothetical protein
LLDRACFALVFEFRRVLCLSKAPFGNPKNNGDFAWVFANRRCGSRSLEARRNNRLATLRVNSKINDLMWILVQKREKKKVALSYFFLRSLRFSVQRAAFTTVNTTDSVTHHNAKST